MLLGWNLTVADDAIFFLLLVISLGIGVYSAFKTRGNTSTLEYILGSRDLSPIAVFLSLLGGVVSAIAILGNATEMYFYGTQLCMSMMGNMFGILIVRNIFLPILYPLHIVSMNEYIELRFSSPGLRKLATGCQLVSSFFYMGICLYVPSITLSSVTGLPTWTSVICMGSIFTFYITIGGARAVVYTDVVQTIMMFGGVLLVTVLCCSQVGGIERVIDLAQEGGRIEFFNLDPSPFVRHTFWSTNVLGIYVIVSMLALNQSQFQRFCSLKSLDTAKTLCMLFPVGFFLLLVLFYLSGLVAYATYADCDPFMSGKIEKPDMILPYLVTDRLSKYAGLTGFFVAAVYSGVLSTLSSQGSAIACIIWEDLLKNRPYFHHFTDKQATNVIKILSGITGVAAIALGMIVGHLGTIFMVAYSIMSALKGPLGGLFLSGICTPWVNRKGAAVGFVASFMINVWLIIGKFLRGGGNPTTLPLSVSGCDGNSVTFQNATSSVVDHMPVPPSSDIAFPPMGKYNNLYDISYCYSGFIGIILTLVISSFVSVCTGPLPQKTVNQQ
ncbi:sodium-coupled monocarboxylate transporter 1-like [Macrobrachium rosenbergii]|uniref:sodium-coupled monocarboxylate transporter 1-like n=1 Tax=Macrobrachium rosenbergii TaxID=79674 RepID=UPI0034D5E93D